MKNLTLIPVVLPTEEASLYLHGDKLYDNKTTMHIPDGSQIPQHLYLCSTLPISRYDWAFNSKNNKVFNVNYDTLLENISNCLKIEFATDPKLIADGVPAIDGNTKARVNMWYKDFNFVSEFVKRYNEKDNQKEVDVLEDIKVQISKFVWYDEDNEEQISYHKVIDILDANNQALQSNTGRFSLEDMRKCWSDGHSIGHTNGLMYDMEEQQSDKTFEDFIQSLTKEQPKGDIIIECEMEKFINRMKPGNEVEYKIKLNSNNQPILIFK